MRKLTTVAGKSILLALMALPSGCQAQPSAAQQSQNQRVLRAVPGCEGCEAIWERDPATLGPRITLAGPNEPGERLLIRGTVYQADGRTPAPGVVIYIHHTNAAGLYANGSNDSEWSRRHGRLRGWLKTGADGRYEVRTIKAGQYPDERGPAHVHLFILEPGKKDPTWIDDVVFAGEAGVDAAYLRRRENRGGSGVMRLAPNPEGGWIAERDIFLGQIR